jgi:uncharacterized short protein YbdD (DUF466 family)
MTRPRASSLFRIAGILTRMARLMVGVPDYEAYVAHRRERHPGEPVMNREDFFKDRQASRYAARGGKIGRCC